MMRWFDAQGGHLEKKGLDANRNVIVVPQHRHHVNLNIFRVDVGLKYNVNTHWQLEANVPYEVKEQGATLEKIEPATPEDWRAIERNRDVHHRNETYTGFTDMELLLGYKRGIFKNGDMLLTGLGTTLPIGKTEEDPWKLGDAGREHLHIQFGTGTFNPIANVHYSFPIYGGMSVSGSVRGKLPLYENSKAYRAPREVTYTAGVNYQFLNRISLHASYLGFYQGYAYWEGERDINTGLRFSMVSFGTSFAIPSNLAVAATLMLPLSQETLYAESDAFEFGPLLSLTMLHTF